MATTSSDLPPTGIGEISDTILFSTSSAILPPTFGGTTIFTTTFHPTTMYTGIAGTSLPAPTVLPTNGYGGSWYKSDFSAPVYDVSDDPNVNRVINWSMIDKFAQDTANILSVEGICLGLCLTALVYVMALTPTKKRRQPFHVLLLLALLAEIINLLFDIVRATQPGISKYSAYLALTGDINSTYWSSQYINLSIAKHCGAIFAYLFTIACLCLQASSLMSNIRIHHKVIYWAILSILVISSLVTLGFRVAFAVIQVSALQHKNLNPPVAMLQQCTVIAYGISLGGWCLVSLTSVIYILATRLRMAFTGNKLYQTALAVLAFVTMESLVLPLVFCVLNLIFSQSAIIQVDQLIIPTVLVLLPLSSLFTTAHSTVFKPAEEARLHFAGQELSTHALIDSNSATAVLDAADIPELPNHAAGESYKMRNLALPPRNPFETPNDREARAFDDSEDEEDLDMSRASYGDVLKQRARRVTRNLASRNVTPQGSQAAIV